MASQPIIPVSELNLFSKRPVQMSVESGQVVEIMPSGVYTADTNIIFHVPGVPDQFLAPDFWFLVTAEIRNQGDTSLAADAEVAPCSNFAHSMWRDIEIKLGNTTISGRNSLYPYQAYIDNIFFASTDTKNWTDRPEMLYRNKSGFFDVNDDHNPGFEKRRTIAAGSAEFQMYFRLHSDICNQPRLILPGVSATIILQPSSNSFRIQSSVALANRNQIVKIKSMKLHIRRVTVNTKLYLDVIQSLQYRPAQYPIRRIAMTNFQKNAGTLEIGENIVTNSILPSTVFLFITDSNRIIGNYAESPFKIDIEGLKSAYLVSEGRQYPNIAYQPTSATGVSREFNALMKATGFYNTQLAPDIDFDDFVQNYGLLAFDLSRNADPTIGSAPRQGTVTVHLAYSIAITTPKNYIFYMVQDSNVFINANLDVSTDYIVNV